jgi:tetratricopeptide (TPR) repeat protein
LGEFHQVLRREPDNADAHFGVARILAGQNDSRGAMREYETVLTLRPDDVRAHLNLGQLHEERSEYEAAMRSYAEAVRIDPRNVLARQNYGLLLFRAGAIEQAMDQMRTILEKLDPNFCPGWLNAAAMTARQGDLLGEPHKKIEHYLQAAEYLRVATIVNKESADAYRQRGIVLMKLSLLQPRQPALGSISEAIAAFRRAVELKPDDAEAAHFAQAAEVERQRRQDSRDAR